MAARVWCVALLCVAVVAGYATPDDTTALAAQLGTRVCLATGDSVTVTTTAPPGYAVHVYPSNLWWSTWIPATRTLVQQCTAWSSAAMESHALQPDVPVTFTVPPGVRSEFWFFGVAAANCARNVSAITYNVSVAYAGAATNAFECMSINERAWSELLMEWMAVRNSDVFDVLHLDVASIVILYITFAVFTILCVVFAMTSKRDVTAWSIATSRLSVLACVVAALTYFLLGSGTGFVYVYRTPGGWSWDDEVATLSALNSTERPVVYPIALVRFMTRPVSAGIVAYLVARHLGYDDWYTGVVAAMAAACQACATLTLAPSKWTVAFVGWVCMCVMLSMVRKGAKKSSHILPVLAVLWVSDCLVWVGTDALHTTPVWINVTLHAVLDACSQGFILVSLRRGAYKRASRIELGLDVEDPCSVEVGAAGVLEEMG